MTIFGYARMTILDDVPEDQMRALREAGCELIYEETEPQPRTLHFKKEWRRMVLQARPGDTVIVYQLSRVVTGFQGIVEVVIDLAARGIYFRSLGDGLDSREGGVLSTMRAARQFTFDMRKAAQRQCQRAFRDKRKPFRKRGRMPGGMPSIFGKQARMEVEALVERGWTKTQIAEFMGFDRKTFYKPRGKEMLAEIERVKQERFALEAAEREREKSLELAAKAEEGNGDATRGG